jgi:hypothetical protein
MPKDNKQTLCLSLLKTLFNNCSITLAVTAAEMASVMADISVLLWMDLSNLGILAGFSSVFILEAVQQTPMTINAPQNYLVASISQIQPDQYSTDAQRQQANIVSIPAQDLELDPSF